MRLERLSLAEWENALPETGIEVFHDPDALSVLDDHASGDLVLLGGFKGDRATALLPLFVRDMALGRVVTSPPPGFGVPGLGPVLMPASPKRRKQEQVNRTFTEKVVDELDLDGARTLFKMTCQPGFTDPRPFVWDGFDLGTRFTYRIDLSTTTPDEQLSAASKSLRREIGDAEELDVDVTRGGLPAAKLVFEEARARYEQQGESFPMTWAYVRDLFTALGDDARTYAVRSPEGEFLTGVTALYSPDAAYFWQGGARTVHEGVAVNSNLHWEILRDVVTDPPTETVTAYDLYGANTERLCRYKSKFGAELVPYHVIDTGGLRMRLAERAYNAMRG
ncbi:GNAT family N-acetyltransferase [Halorubrum sp. JWXQ-INN 858]|uniref:GNAT family N-acetyltransferase n=1 Tax=Halorubrum sp. JWXQ-INN 858 TaxID=2690782 RepID=UPI001356743F|nr:GNAT family N-acetyltransferase [Halorubrum sp. JWXQ-INN 858]MWV65483.1 GNAT family N-acetyltransferase [Halorubrum sp. JWXQ-INN 858]